LIGIMDCIAADLDAYVDIAVTLGRDRQRRNDLGGRIAEASRVLYEDDMAVRAFEAFLWSVINDRRDTPS
jgi:predicted O-linked N-acetylglucosamine transferase (SPINDLY family)